MCDMADVYASVVKSEVYCELRHRSSNTCARDDVCKVSSALDEICTASDDEQRRAVRNAEDVRSALPTNMNEKPSIVDLRHMTTRLDLDICENLPRNELLAPEKQANQNAEASAMEFDSAECRLLRGL